MFRLASLVLVVLILDAQTPTSFAGVKKGKPPVNQEQKDAAFQQLFASLFAQWDANRDGKLDLKELNAVVTNPAVHGNDSAIAVVVRRRLLRDDNSRTNGLTLVEMQALGTEPQMQRAVSGSARHIQSINHALFLAEDPNLATFHQGGMGDCYLLAVIGALVYQHPDAVRKMIQPQLGGGYEVQFGNGKKVAVPPVTDAELIMGANEGHDHGIWLSVLEKAFSELARAKRLEKTGRTVEDEEAVVSDLIGHAGYYSPVIALFTGHKTAGPPTGKWLKENPQGAAEKMHELLAKLSSEHRVMAVCTGGDKAKKLPKGIIHGHVFAVLGYNPSTRMVQMFNPWGNHVASANPPGPINGYPTQHGIFEVPVAEFIHIFSALSYETELASQ